MFSRIGQKTDLFARFSTVGGEKGSSDSARDPRGMSIKFYTKEGNWDWVFNNTPVFFIRDPALFPVFIHTQKRNPGTNLKDASYFWDYLSSHQESIHQVMYTFSDRGTPYSYRHMNAYSGHTFKFTKDDGSFKYVQIHIKTDQGIKNLTNEEAATMHSTNRTGRHKTYLRPSRKESTHHGRCTFKFLTLQMPKIIVGTFST